jgi:hypothetical protein
MVGDGKTKVTSIVKKAGSLIKFIPVTMCYMLIHNDHRQKEFFLLTSRHQSQADPMKKKGRNHGHGKA